MGLLSRYLQVPRPTRFLHFMSLRTGVEMISLSMIFNKLTGFYGLLAVLTGFHLSPLQLSMYIYSCVALVLLAFLMPHIRQQSPFHNLALAYFYLMDAVVNTAFTAAFAITWFLAISAIDSNQAIPSGAPGKQTIEDAAGFTSPKYNVSGVEVIVSPGSATTGQDAVAYGVAGMAASSAASPSIGHGVGIEESMPSIMIVVLMTLIRVYFILIVMAYARQVIRQQVFSEGVGRLHQAPVDGNMDDSIGQNPFAVGTQTGEGWQGKLGRMMIMVGEGYWLGGRTADETWIKGLDGRFKTNKVLHGPPGTIERERRARSGTGPPKPPPSLKL